MLRSSTRPAGLGLLLLALACTQALAVLAHPDHDHDGGAGMMAAPQAPAPQAPLPVEEEGGDDRPLLPGSGNMDSPCYANPTAQECAAFKRSDEDWTDDIEQLCSATPYLIGCYLWRQCRSGAATGKYCALPSLAANLCYDMPLINATSAEGCEAWSALCGVEGSMVAQCTSPGPVPDIINTLTTRDGINSICYTHFMDGCNECTPLEGPDVHDFENCTFPGPLPIFAHMCYAMAGMPECSETGFKAMCADPEVSATFPAVCVEPPNPTEIQPASPPPAAAPPPEGATPTGAPAPAPAAPASGAAWGQTPQAAALLLAALLAAAAAL